VYDGPCQVTLFLAVRLVHSLKDKGFSKVRGRVGKKGDGNNLKLNLTEASGEAVHENEDFDEGNMQVESRLVSNLKRMKLGLVQTKDKEKTNVGEGEQPMGDAFQCCC
jgi:hypothetical protein